MRKVILTAIAISALSMGGAFAQSKSANPVDGSGNAKGAQTLDPAGTEAAKKDAMTAPKAPTKMDKTGSSANPVDGSGSAKGAQNLDGAGTKAMKKDAMVPAKKTTGANNAGAGTDKGNGGDGGSAGK